ncbi:MAG: ferric reductase-like transmembrane domain-containing protein [Deltaproteobacteria bacterium]|nr:ferric reductase-like transmembrane domain-containing protein [bacterium]MCB9489127.1 ferric reductase-like transmembrane domain-containing protein [Deltaproteobacteria bacterium]
MNAMHAGSFVPGIEGAPTMISPGILAVTLVFTALVYALPAALWPMAEYRENVTVITGHLSILMLCLILLMPFAARFLGGSWKRVMGYRKPLSVAVGIFIVVHAAVVTWMATEGDLHFASINNALNPYGDGCTYMATIMLVLLIATSHPRVQRAMNPKIWKVLQRISVFGILWVGVTSSAGMTIPAVSIAAFVIFAAVIIMRLTQFAIDRSKFDSSAIAANAFWFVAFFSHSIICRLTGQFVQVTLIYAAVCGVCVYAWRTSRSRRVSTGLAA